MPPSVPQILDDLIDQWDVSNHEQERNELIQMLQAFAAQKGVR